LNSFNQETHHRIFVDILTAFDNGLDPSGIDKFSDRTNGFPTTLIESDVDIKVMSIHAILDDAANGTQ
jgi:hypothetical protein